MGEIWEGIRVCGEHCLGMFVGCEEISGRRQKEGQRAELTPIGPEPVGDKEPPKVFPDFKVVWGLGLVWSFATSLEYTGIIPSNIIIL